MERRPRQVIIVTKDSPNIIRSRASLESQRLPRMQVLARVSSSSIRHSIATAGNGNGNERSLESSILSRHLPVSTSVYRSGPLEYFGFRANHAPPHPAINQLDHIASQYEALGFNLNWWRREHLTNGADPRVLRTRRVTLAEALKKLPNCKILQKGHGAKHLKNDRNLEGLIHKVADKPPEVKNEDLEPTSIVIDKRFLLNRPELMEEFECPNKEQYRSEKQELLSAWFDQTVEAELTKRTSNILNLGGKEALTIPVLYYHEENVMNNVTNTDPEQEFLDKLLKGSEDLDSQKLEMMF